MNRAIVKPLMLSVLIIPVFTLQSGSSIPMKEGRKANDPKKHPETEAIKASALDYGEGWYEGNVERMQRALHPELAKRVVFKHPQTGRSRMRDMGAMTLVQATKAGGGSRSTFKNAKSKVDILEIYENVAIVKVTGPEWVDFLQMTKWNGHWVIVNVLWEIKPEHRKRIVKSLAFLN